MYLLSAMLLLLRVLSEDSRRMPYLPLFVILFPEIVLLSDDREIEMPCQLFAVMLFPEIVL